MSPIHEHAKFSWIVFLNIHLGYSFNSILLFGHSPFIGGIPPPGRGIVGKIEFDYREFYLGICSDLELDGMAE